MQELAWTEGRIKTISYFKLAAIQNDFFYSLLSYLGCLSSVVFIVCIYMHIHVCVCIYIYVYVYVCIPADVNSLVIFSADQLDEGSLVPMCESLLLVIGA